MEKPEANKEMMWWDLIDSMQCSQANKRIV